MKRRYGLLLGLGLLMAGWGRAGECADWTQGCALFGAFKNREAIPFLERACATDPSNAVYLAKLAHAYNNAGEDLDNRESEPFYEKAVTTAERLRALAPDKPETYWLLGMNYGNLALFRGGKQKVTLSRNIEAMGRKGIETDPAYSPNYAVLGVYYREVALLNPILRAFAQHLMGGLPSGSLADAEKMFLLSIEKDPASQYPRFQLALTYEKMKQPAKALARYREILAMSVTDHQDPRWQARARARLKELGAP